MAVKLRQSAPVGAVSVKSKMSVRRGHPPPDQASPRRKFPNPNTSKPKISNQPSPAKNHHIVDAENKKAGQNMTREKIQYRKSTILVVLQGKHPKPNDQAAHLQHL